MLSARLMWDAVLASAPGEHTRAYTCVCVCVRSWQWHVAHWQVAF